MKRHIRIILCALAAYLILLFLLVAVESNSEDATIHSFWDALWFSVITMTTVGYGDLSPVTHAGRLLGVIFALCSIGILTALIGIGLNLLSGEFLPRIRLRLGRRQKWYIFSVENEDSASLAAALRRGDRDCILLFPPEGESCCCKEKHLHLNWNASEILKLRGGSEGVRLFFMDADERKNYVDALSACEQGLSCCCMCSSAPGEVPEELQLFSPIEAMSRGYWQEHPLLADETIVLLVGCGENGSALLERALLTNAFEKGRRIEYHVFDDTVSFPSLHPEIVRALSPGQPDGDLLVFHSEKWTDARLLIEKADRVIFCYDSDKDNIRALDRLRSWFVASADVHIRLSEDTPGLVCFGTREKMMRPELVIKDELNRRAKLMNDIYNIGEKEPHKWTELSPFLRQSNIAAADHLIVKARCLLENDRLTVLSSEDCRKAAMRWNELTDDRRIRLMEMEHRRWMRFHLMYNWTCDPSRDNPRRRHPLLRPFDELSAEDQAKDAYAWEMLEKIAESQ